MHEIFVLAHGLPGQPVLDDDMGDDIDVACGAGIDGETFETLLNDEVFCEQVRLFCTQFQCNQVFVSRRSFPEGWKVDLDRA